MKKLIYILLCIASVHASGQYANGKIKIYFNRPVDNALANPDSAVFLNTTWADTLCAYINRAKYTIDVTQYDYSESNAADVIASAVNAAFERGVTIRWIDNGSSSNSGVSLINGGISRISSPTGNQYGIMHDKFVVFDAHSPNPEDPIVWTGSPDWSAEMIDSDVNNIIIFQDSALAQAYTAQFNQMWGGPDSVPVTANEKFGPDKVSEGPHYFTIGGSEVELWFSPKDLVNNHIVDMIDSATSQVYFGVYDITEEPNATALVSQKQAGLSVAGVVDQYTVSTGGEAWTILSEGLGNMVMEYKQNNSLYHNKYVITDPCDLTGDPKVLTGSHNWTSSANNENDENTVIIHNADVANIYYQAIYENFTSLGGTLESCITNPAGIETVSDDAFMKVYPNPLAGESWQLEVSNDWIGSTLQIFDAAGKLTYTSEVGNLNSELSPKLAPGVYLMKLTSNSRATVQKLVKL